MSTASLAAHPTRLLTDWARSGLRRFAEPLLADEERGLTRALAGPADQLSWSEATALVAGLAEEPGELGALLRRLRPEPAELYVLALLGAVEDDHLTALVVGQLQKPSGGARPALHLLLALLRSLWPETAWTPATLLDSAFVRAGAIRVEGSEPMPLREALLDAHCWRWLGGGGCRWPGCEELRDSDPELVPAELGRQLPGLARQLRAGRLDGVVLRGPPCSGRRSAALALGRELGGGALLVDGRTYREQAALRLCCAASGLLPVLLPDLAPGEVLALPAAVREAGPVAVVLGQAGSVGADRMLELELHAPGAEERRRWWRQALQEEAPASVADAALIGGPAIRRIAADARLRAERDGSDLQPAHLLAARSALGADALRLLAEPVARRVDRAALVVGEREAAELDDLVARCRQREAVWRDLGPTMACTVSRRVTALFAGASGTGKTLAAAYVASRLDAPLYRVDLSLLMNKYVGETEKNIGRLLDQAAASDVILLFDEADALFGKRTDPGSGNDRFANMLTNFLLTRLEAHDGIVLLTTNNRAHLDRAFARRLDLLVDFTLPGPEQRRELWRSHLGARAPATADLELLALHCDLAGGHIRSIALAAAARCPERIGLPELLRAAEREYRKLGRSFPVALAQRLGDGGPER